VDDFIIEEEEKTARIVGLRYLLFVVLGIFSVMYVDTAILVPEDAATTVNNLLAYMDGYSVGRKRSWNYFFERLNRCMMLAVHELPIFEELDISY
jgi:hypothetical protein